MVEIYVVGHKNPDTDSVCSAIAYADYKNKEQQQEQQEDKYIPVIQGEINDETRFVLEKFSIQTPQILTDGTNKTFVLVDHNERTQTIDNFEKAKIKAIIDHHKLDFSYNEPIFCHTEPIGSTATIIAEFYFKNNINLDKNIAGILLGALLSDTVVFRSPTTTPKDKEIAKRLAEIAGIQDIEKFGIEVKKAKASLKGKTADEIIFSDFKEYNMNGHKVGIGQIEVVGFDEFNEIKQQIQEQMNKIKEEKNYALILLMATDIIREGSELIVAGDVDAIKKAFNIPTIEGTFIQGLMSRKKQAVPVLTEYYNKQ